MGRIGKIGVAVVFLKLLKTILMGCGALKKITTLMYKTSLKINSRINFKKFFLIFFITNKNKM